MHHWANRGLWRRSLGHFDVVRRPRAFGEKHNSSLLSELLNGDTVSYMVNYPSGLDDVFKALSDPTRRAVVHRLATGPASVKELARPFDMGLPAFLKHIAVLEDSQLLETHKTGRVRICQLVPERLKATSTWFEDQISLWEGRSERLAAFVEHQHREESK